MRPLADTRLSPRQRWSATVAVAGAVVAWDVALFLVVGGPAPSRPLLARAALLDAALALPIAALALSISEPVSLRLARSPGRVRAVQWMASAALAAVAFAVLLVPAAALREGAVALAARAGRWEGTAGAPSSPIDAGRWLCAAAISPSTTAGAAGFPLVAIVRAALLLQIPALPAFFAALTLARRGGVAGNALLLAAALAAPGALILAADPRPPHGDATLGPGCRPGLEVRIYSVSAVETDPAPSVGEGGIARAQGFALNRDLPAIQAAGRPALAGRAPREPSGGIVQPLVLRAKLGECLHVVFTNRATGPAAFRVHGLPHLATALDAVGALPPDYEARPGETVTYSLEVPSDPEWARAYLVQGSRDARAVLIIEPRGRADGVDPTAGMRGALGRPARPARAEASASSTAGRSSPP